MSISTRRDIKHKNTHLSNNSKQAHVTALVANNTDDTASKSLQTSDIYLPL